MIDTGIETVYSEEMKRTLWFRRSMDATRNLSVLSLAAMICFTFGLPDTSSHLVMILGSLVIFAFQIFEARAHLFAEASEERIRIIERNYLATPPAGPVKEWREELAKSLMESEPPIGFVEAFAARTLRNYIIIFLTLDICWFAKLYLFPQPAPDWASFVHRLDSGFIPGWFFLLFAGAFWAIYFGLAIWYIIRTKGREARY
jgi:uncharacterized membrane protein